MGMAARVLPDDEVLDAMLAKAGEMAQWPVSSLQAIKQTLMQANRGPVQSALQIEDELMGRLAGSPENVEAITAFIEKRTPDFKQFRK